MLEDLFDQPLPSNLKADQHQQDHQHQQQQQQHQQQLSIVITSIIFHVV